MSDAPRCVYCRVRPVAPEWRPFCSERCKMADLGRWLSGGYRVAGTPADTTPPERTTGVDETDDPDSSDE